MTNTDPNAWLMGGGGPPSFSWKDKPIGTTYGGEITDLQMRQQLDFATKQPKVWDDGNPMMQLEVTVKTDERDPSVEDDDGTRRLFVKGQMQAAVREAIKSAGADGLRVGGKLAVRFVREEPSNRGNPKKVYEAAYKPPAPGGDVDTFLGTSPAAAQQPDLSSVL